eukprot:6186747-Pleurochrysis_carterae.AAC.2
MSKSAKPSPPAANTRSRRLRPLLARQLSKCCARWAVLQIYACNNSMWTPPTFKVHSKETTEKCTSAPLPTSATSTMAVYQSYGNYSSRSMARRMPGASGTARPRSSSSRHRGLRNLSSTPAAFSRSTTTTRVASSRSGVIRRTDTVGRG